MHLINGILSIRIRVDSNQDVFKVCTSIKQKSFNIVIRKKKVFFKSPHLHFKLHTWYVIEMISFVDRERILREDIT